MNELNLQKYYEILSTNVEKLLDGRSDAWLAEKSDTDATGISKLKKQKKGNIGYAILIKWAAALGLEPWEILMPGASAAEIPNVTLSHAVRVLSAYEKLEPHIRASVDRLLFPSQSEADSVSAHVQSALSPEKPSRSES